MNAQRFLAVGLLPLALLAARLKADAYWHGPPACGEPTVRVVPLPLERFGEADLGACTVSISSRWRWPWPALCTIVIHEFGHLHGLGHDSGRWVMSARYRGALGTCEKTSPWLATQLESDWPE